MLSFGNQCLGLHVLAALGMARGQMSNILISDNQQSRLLRHTWIDCASHRGGHIGSLTPDNGKRSGKHHDFAEKYAIEIAVACNAVMAIAIDWLIRTNQPIFQRSSGLGDSAKQDQAR